MKKILLLFSTLALASACFLSTSYGEKSKTNFMKTGVEATPDKTREGDLVPTQVYVASEDKSSESPLWKEILLYLSGPLGILIGAFINGRISTRIARERFKADLDIKKVETETRFREKVYLEAAEGFAVAMNKYNTLMSLNEVNQTSDEHDIRFMSDVFKIDLIASDSTLLAVSNFQRVYYRALLEVSALVFGVQKMSSEAERYGKNIEENLEYQRQLNANWSVLPPSEKGSAQAAEFANRARELQEEFEILFRKRNEIWEKLPAKRVEVSRAGLTLGRPIAIALGEINLSIRREIQFSLDEDGYRNRIVSSYAEISESFEDFLRRIEQMFNENG